MRRALRSLVAVAIISFASACGGGSGGSAPVTDGISGAIATPAPSPAPTPAPTTAAVTPAGYILTKTTAGADDLIAGFDIAQGLQPSWGTGAVPGIYDPNEGAFRFVCGGGGALAKDDPLLYYKQPGAAHLHQVWGNADFTDSTTPQSLAASNITNCNATPYSLNRSSYWMPALLHDSGDAVLPDLVTVYYKRAKASSDYCNPNSPKFIGICVGLPNQLRMIFGWDSTKPNAKVSGASWYCTGGTGQHYPDLDAVFASGCKAGDTLVGNTVAPNCWDGKNLDSPDHRSHMAYADYARGDGLLHCPATHPYLLPQEENKVMWTVTADMIGTRADGSKYSRIRLSSDAMLAGAKPGETMHADYIEAWVGSAKKMWMDNCIDKGLDCSGGDLGNGRQLIGASQPTYGWVNPKPRVAWTDPGKT